MFVALMQLVVGGLVFVPRHLAFVEALLEVVLADEVKMRIEHGLTNPLAIGFELGVGGDDAGAVLLNIFGELK